MKPSLPFSAAACGLLFVVSVPAMAQVPPAAQVIVTAARLAQPPDEVLADVRVIDRDLIERAGSTGLAQLLQRHGGVEISASGGAGQVSGVFLRGSNANHVVLLIDGVRVNSATAGTNAFEHLPLAMIERIEVLHGPASGLYGADAIGGVIQIFTRRDDGLQGRVELGSEDTRALSAAFGRQFGATRLSLQAGWRASRSDSATNADNPWSFNADRDPYRNANAGLQLEHEWAAGQTVALRGQTSEGRTHFDIGAGSDDVNRQRLSTWALESRNRLSPTWSSLLRVARGVDDMRSDGASTSRFRSDQDQLTWQNDVEAWGGRIAAGAEWRREQVDADTAYTVDARTVSSLFGAYSARQGAQQMQLALRHDRNSQFGARSTGNLGWGWQMAPGWRVSAGAGTAFKAPSFNDLYYPLQFGYSGNPDLRPERARSLEAALRYEDRRLQGSLTVFDNRIRDLIAINSSFTTVDNVARARIQGATLALGWRAAQWRARAEWTHQQAEDADSGARLARRAEDFGSLGLDWVQGPWRAGLGLVASGARVDSSGAALGGYGLLNLSAAWALAPRWTLSARVDNLGDKGYTLVQGYNTPRRAAFVALEFHDR